MAGMGKCGSKHAIVRCWIHGGGNFFVPWLLAVVQGGITEGV